MGWKWINGNRYYYRCRRVGGRVVTEYRGGDLLGGLDELREQERRQDRQEKREMDREEMAGIMAADRKADKAVKDVFTLVNAALLVNGYHKHHQGEWRKRRHDTNRK